MKLFNRNKQAKSISEFRDTAAHLDKDEAINAITGGTMSGCHTGGKSGISYSNRVLSTGVFNSFNASAMNLQF